MTFVQSSLRAHCSLRRHYNRPMGRTLRVALLGVRVQEARRYHVSIQALAPGQAPIGVVVLTDMGSEQYRPEQVARTETSEPTKHPEFLNRVFILRLSEPLGAALAPQISLHCNLFALPSADSTAPGAIIAGREVDELIGSATVQVRGDMAQRLLRGERCTLPVVLNDSGRGDDTQGTKDLMASLYGGTAAKELLLELQLLDAQVPLPRDVYDLQLSSQHTLTHTGTQGTTTLQRGGPQPGAECKLMVLVTRAENLPTVRSADGKTEEDPSTFVALKSARDVRNSVPAQASTHVCPSSTAPVWGQLLQVRYLEEDLPTEELHINIVNDQDSRLMLKATVPLTHILPRLHYNLKLLMPGGPMGSHVALYVTLCLVDCPKCELRHLKALGTHATHVLSGALASTTTPLHTLVPPDTHNTLTPGAQIMAVWKLTHPNTTTTTTTTAAEPLSIDSVYTTVDAGSVNAVGKRLEAMSESVTAALQASGGGGEGGGGAGGALHQPCDMLPVHVVPPGSVTMGDQLVWPPDHMVQMPVNLTSPDSSLQLQLHMLAPGASHSTPVARVEVAREKLDALRTQPTLIEGLTLQGPNAKGATCILELGRWQSAAYQEHLTKPLPGQDNEGVSGLQGDTHTPMTWQDRGGVGGVGGAAAAVLETLVDDLVHKQVALERVSRQMDTAECRAEVMGWRLSDAQHQIRTLQEDMQKLRQLLHEDKESFKQPLLESLAKLSKEDVCEKAEHALGAYARERRRNTELVHRLQQMHAEQVDVLEMKKRYQELQGAHMEMMRVMNSMEGPLVGRITAYRQTMKTQEEVINKLEHVLADVLSKTRTIGLDSKAREQAEAEQRRLKRHLTQEHERAKQQLAAENQRLQDQLRATSAAATRRTTNIAEELEQARAESRTLRDEVQRLHDELALTREAADRLKGESGSAQDELGQLRNANSELVQENVTASLKLKQAEERTAAARDELVTAIKRYAGDIADLKWRLAEKDAQLMGGFGSPARLNDRDDDLGIPRVNPALFNHINSATGVNNSPPHTATHTSTAPRSPHTRTTPRGASADAAGATSTTAAATAAAAGKLSSSRSLSAGSQQQARLAAAAAAAAAGSAEGPNGQSVAAAGEGQDRASKTSRPAQQQQQQGQALATSSSLKAVRSSDSTRPSHTTTHTATHTANTTGPNDTTAQSGTGAGYVAQPALKPAQSLEKRSSNVQRDSAASQAARPSK